MVLLQMHSDITVCISYVILIFSNILYYINFTNKLGNTNIQKYCATFHLLLQNKIGKKSRLKLNSFPNIQSKHETEFQKN